MTYQQAIELVERLSEIDIDRNDGVPGLYAVKSENQTFSQIPPYDMDCEWYVLCNERGRIDDPDYGKDDV